LLLALRLPRSTLVVVPVVPAAAGREKGSFLLLGVLSHGWIRVVAAAAAVEEGASPWPMFKPSFSAPSPLGMRCALRGLPVDDSAVDDDPVEEVVDDGEEGVVFIPARGLLGESCCLSFCCCCCCWLANASGGGGGDIGRGTSRSEEEPSFLGHRVATTEP
jgi:hypothetical protein